MAFSNNLIDSVLGVYASFHTMGNPVRTTYSLKSDMFKCFLTIPTSDSDILDIPLMLNNGQLEDYLQYKKVKIPLFVNDSEPPRKTFDPFIKDCFIRTSHHIRLRKFVTSKGETYYGGKGILLNKDFKILLLCVNRYFKNTDEESYDLYNYKEICYISDRVFENTEDFMSKNIIKKIIPIFRIEHSRWCTKPDIIINSNLDYWVGFPKKPKVTKTNESLNNFCVENMEDILEDFVW